MLRSDYRHDGKESVLLNKSQQYIKKQVENKINSGEYSFKEISCPICGGNTFDKLSEKERFGLFMPVVICTNCGLIMSNPRMAEDAISAFYKNYYGTLLRKEEKPSHEYFKRQHERGRAIYRYIETKTQKSFGHGDIVLDVGCGAGGILHYFQERGCIVKGVDLGTEYIEFGKSNYNLDLEEGHIYNVNLSKPPNLIIYSHVFEHILEPNSELQHIYNLLAEKGLLYIALPGIKNLRNSYSSSLLNYLMISHMFHFTMETLNNLLSKNHFHLYTGNQKIESIFIKTCMTKEMSHYKSDYYDAMRYLKTLSYYSFFLNKKQKLRAIASKIKKTLGI